MLNKRLRLVEARACYIWRTMTRLCFQRLAKGTKKLPSLGNAGDSCCRQSKAYTASRSQVSAFDSQLRNTGSEGQPLQHVTDPNNYRRVAATSSLIHVGSTGVTG